MSMYLDVTSFVYIITESLFHRYTRICLVYSVCAFRCFVVYLTFFTHDRRTKSFMKTCSLQTENQA
jgi:hypothetical protein